MLFACVERLELAFKFGLKFLVGGIDMVGGRHSSFNIFNHFTSLTVVLVKSKAGLAI